MQSVRGDQRSADTCGSKLWICYLLEVNLWTNDSIFIPQFSQQIYEQENNIIYLV